MKKAKVLISTLTLSGVLAASVIGNGSVNLFSEDGIVVKADTISDLEQQVSHAQAELQDAQQNLQQANSAVSTAQQNLTASKQKVSSLDDEWGKLESELLVIEDKYYALSTAEKESDAGKAMYM